MKKTLAKIWVPTLLVLVAAMQSFGIDTRRAVGLARLSDSLALLRTGDSASAADLAADSVSATLTSADSIAIDTLLTDSLVKDTAVIVHARDTITVPDSLKETDPFFYKYYIAVKDPETLALVRDSLFMAGDTLELHMLDSLYRKDSTEVAQAAYDAWYASLSRKERKKEDAKKALPGLIAEANRKLAGESGMPHILRIEIFCDQYLIPVSGRAHLRLQNGNFL